MGLLQRHHSILLINPERADSSACQLEKCHLGSFPFSKMLAVIHNLICSQQKHISISLENEVIIYHGMELK